MFKWPAVAYPYAAHLPLSHRGFRLSRACVDQCVCVCRTHWQAMVFLELSIEVLSGDKVFASINVLGELPKRLTYAQVVKVAFSLHFERLILIAPPLTV